MISNLSHLRRWAKREFRTKRQDVLRFSFFRTTRSFTRTYARNKRSLYTPYSR